MVGDELNASSDPLDQLVDCRTRRTRLAQIPTGHDGGWPVFDEPLDSLFESCRHASEFQCRHPAGTRLDLGNNGTVELDRASQTPPA